MTSPFHPPEKIHAVMKLYFEGFSIRIVGDKTGLTKNSATGIVTRNRDKPAWVHLHRKKRYVIEDNPERKVASIASVFPTRLRRLSRGARHRECQYIAGEPSVDNRCKCLRETIEGSSYCAEHHEICHWKYPLKSQVAA